MIAKLWNMFYHLFDALAQITGMSNEGLILLTIVLFFVVMFIRSYSRTIDRMFPHN